MARVTWSAAAGKPSVARAPDVLSLAGAEPPPLLTPSSAAMPSGRKRCMALCEPDGKFHEAVVEAYDEEQETYLVGEGGVGQGATFASH